MVTRIASSAVNATDVPSSTGADAFAVSTAPARYLPVVPPMPTARVD